MFRRIMLVALLIVTALAVSAQNSASILHLIPVNLIGPEIVLSPDGTTLAVYENPVLVEYIATPENLPIRLIDLADGVEIGTLEGEQTDMTRDVAFSPDGSRMVSLQMNGELIVWDVASQSVIASYDWLPFGGGEIDFIPDGNTLVLLYNTGTQGQHLLFDLETGSITDTLRVAPATFNEFRTLPSNMQEQFSYGAVAQTVGPNGAIYGATPNGEVFVWNAAERTRTSLQGESEEGFARFNVRRIQPLSDGSVVYYDNDTTMTVWVAADGTQTLYPFGRHSFAVTDEGRLAYVVREDGMLYVTDLTAASPEPQPVARDISEDLSFAGQPILAFTAEGGLVIGGLYSEHMQNAIVVVELQ